LAEKNKLEIIIAGFGGQGVILAGVILGVAAAVHDGKNVTQTQSYGAESRGGAARSEVIISDAKIGFPEVEECDVLVAMSQEALNKHASTVRENGAIIVDGDLVKDRPPKAQTSLFKIPATRMSDERFGTKIYANMIMLGALAKLTAATTTEAMRKAVSENVPKRSERENLEALELGISYAEKQEKQWTSDDR